LDNHRLNFILKYIFNKLDSLMKKYFQYNNITKEKIDLFDNVKKELGGVE